MRVGIVGGGYAGRMAAVGLRRRGHDVVLVDAQPGWVERTRLHEAAAYGRSVVHDHRRLTDAIGARFREGRVVGVEPGRLVLAAGGPESVDAVVVTAGSVVDRRVPGVADHALALGSPDEARRVHARLGGLPEGAEVVVVGAGLTGIELATEVAEHWPHLRVSVLGDPLQALSPSGVRAMTAAFDGLGIRRGAGRVREVVADGLETDRGFLRADLVLWGAGMQAPTWLCDAGLPLDGSGRVAVDASLMVRGLPMVAAAGDCAGTRLRMGCATAMPMGSHVADSLHRVSRGQEPVPMRFGYAMRCISLGRRGALIQRTRADDAPAAQTLRGRTGMWVKEAILHMAVGIPQWEARAGLGLYAWPGGPRVVAASRQLKGGERVAGGEGRVMAGGL